MRRLFFVFVVCMLFAPVAYAGETDHILNILLKKGVISEQEYEAVKGELKTEGEKKQVQLNTKIAEAIEYNKPQEEGDGEWAKRIKLSGLFEGEYRWMESRDISDKDSDSTSDLYLRRIELGIEAGLTDWINANAVLNSEFIGDDVNQGDEKITVDEATITLQKEGFPLYLVIGKKAQPFGVFENHLITDPMTQDAFETKRVGLTLGATGPVGLDVSASLYKGEEQMDHLAGSALFDTDNDDSTDIRAGEAGDDVGSYILSASISPIEDHIQLFAAYLSEPGRGERNNTVGLGFTAGIPGIEGFRFDGEYMKALNREIYDGLDETFKEGAFSVTASYAVNNGDRGEDVGGATFAERLAHVLEEPLHFAVRYERFDDDDLAEETSSWSAKNRYSLGVRYPFYRDKEKGLAAYVAAEYRYTDYRLHSSLEDTRTDNNQEMFARLGVAF
ncbi:MAG: LbtU family siderophore porin [Nitrospiraceae bacterium]|nr:MAG: LbtU family siderophore porin [Nitrospiraceae bacterium]